MSLMLVASKPSRTKRARAASRSAVRVRSRRGGSAGRRMSTSRGGVEDRVAGVVPGDERDAGPAVAPRAAEVQPLDRDLQVTPPTRARPERAHLLGMEQGMGEVAAGAAEHQL